MARGEYTYSCRRDRPTPVWVRVLSQASDEAAIEEGRLLLRSQAALASSGPLAIAVGRGREGDADFRWLGTWSYNGAARWKPEPPSH